MPHTNQRQRKILSPYTIDPSTQTAVFGDPTLGSPGAQGSVEAPATTVQPVYEAGTLPGPQEQQAATGVQRSPGSVVHPAFAPSATRSVEPVGPQQVEQAGVAGRHKLPRGGSAPLMQTAEPQTAIQGPGMAPSQPMAAQSPAVMHARAGRPAGQIQTPTTLGEHVRASVTAASEGQAVRTPPMTVVDEGRNFVLAFELPGVAKEDIEIFGRENELVLEASPESKAGEGALVTSESPEHVFKRQIPLDVEVEIENVDATFRNGVLEVTLPKQDPTSGLQAIEVE